MNFINVIPVAKVRLEIEFLSERFALLFLGGESWNRIETTKEKVEVKGAEKDARRGDRGKKSG